MPDIVAMLAHITPKAGQAGTLRQVLTAMVAPTRLEPGCISYNLHELQAGPAVGFLFYEVWRSQHDLDVHMETVHVRSLIERQDELVDGAIRIDRLTLLP